MRTSRPEPHSLAGAYALDALAGKDLVRFERHLAGCPPCAAELRTLRVVDRGCLIAPLPGSRAA